MQVTTSPFHISLLIQKCDLGDAVDRALKKKFGKAEDWHDNRGGYFYTRFSHVMEGLRLTIEAKTHFHGEIGSLTPANGIVPNLIFVFSRCAGANPCCQIGDIVIVDDPFPQSGIPAPSRQLLAASARCFSDIEDALPLIKADGVDMYQAVRDILQLLSTGRKQILEIKKQLDLSPADWTTVCKKVLQPGEMMLWKRSADYYYELDDAGRAKLAKADEFSTKYPRKPAILLAKSDSDTMIRSTTEDKTAWVVDQLSARVFGSDEARAGRPIVNVCAVRCREGQNIEAESPYVRTIGEALVEFMLQVAKRYKQLV